MSYHCTNLNMEHLQISTEKFKFKIPQNEKIYGNNDLYGKIHTITLNDSPLECFTYLHKYIPSTMTNTPYLFVGQNRYTDELLKTLVKDIKTINDTNIKFQYIPVLPVTLHICKGTYIDKKIIRSNVDLHKAIQGKCIMPKVTFIIYEYPKYKIICNNESQYDKHPYTEIKMKCSEFIIKDCPDFFLMDYHNFSSYTDNISCKFATNPTQSGMGYFHYGKEQILLNFPLLKNVSIMKINNNNMIQIMINKFQRNILNNIRHQLYNVMKKFITDDAEHIFAEYCHHYGDVIDENYSFSGKAIYLTTDTKIYNEQNDGTFSEININSLQVNRDMFVINNSTDINMFVVLKFPYVMCKRINVNDLYFPCKVHKIYVTKSNKMKKWYYPNIKTDIDKLDLSDLVMKLNTNEEIFDDITFEI